MCGIVGFTGSNNAGEFLIEGLKKLEYRGYDSSGVAFIDNDEINITKKSGKIKNLEDIVKFTGNEKIGIGHTRWATHGAPSDINAHPHASSDGKIVVVYNGIIENSGELKQMLEYNGVKFVSETDTEVIPNLIAYYYNGNMLATITRILPMLRGSYALGIISKDDPDRIFAVRKDSPLVIGIGEGENYIASDTLACLDRTKKYIYLNDYDVAVITSDSVKVYNDGNEVQREAVTVNLDAEAASKGGYESFMLKEMYEQGKAVERTLNQFFGYDGIEIQALDGIGKFDNVRFVACGSAYHAAVSGKYIFEKYCGIDSEAETASEFRYRNPVINEKTLVIGISQSGETADTLAALKLAKSKGAETLAIVNVAGSSIAREADRVIHTFAGPEIAVATTKAYSAQLAVVYMIALKILDMQRKDISGFMKAVRELPKHIEETCAKAEAAKKAAAKIAKASGVFFIGRGTDYASSMEGSLKLKEISYIPSEAYAAGELKHGTISLIDNNTVVMAVVSGKEIAEKMISNIKEVKARGAYVIAIAAEGTIDSRTADEIFEIPALDDMFMPSLSIIPMQFYAYYTAQELGRDIDKPRNLAKSVTVE